MKETDHLRSIAVAVFLLCLFISSETREQYDYLIPYPSGRHGPSHGNRYVREIQPEKYGSVTHETAQSSTSLELPLTTVSSFTVTTNKSHAIFGHVARVSSPFATVSVLEPVGGGCENNTLAKVVDTARAHKCLVAVNAGFFNTTSHECLGNVVSDGRFVQDSGGLQNSQFGIFRNGTMFFGYLADDYDIEEMDEFQQLVGGVIWLLRDGEIYVNESIAAESEETQETGELSEFASVLSGRCAVGHDAEGHLVLVHIDGRTRHRGMDLWEFSDLLLDLGLVNAINLDGGGSTTFVINDTTVNYPSDYCSDADDEILNCDRKVSTVVCAREPYCEPLDCNGHGDCVLGECICHGTWQPPSCDSLHCGHSNCSDHGQCTESGCSCNTGWTGEECESACPEGSFGQHCSEQCRCVHSSFCDPADGSCVCEPGYMGTLCDQSCPPGLYGENCSRNCYCTEGCSCDPVTGECSAEITDDYLNAAAICMAKEMIKDAEAEEADNQQYRIWLGTVIGMTIIATLSILLNIIVFCACPGKVRRQQGKNAMMDASKEAQLSSSEEDSF